MLFFAAERLLGTKQAALFGALALWQPLVPWIVYGLDLWRTRSVALCKLLHCHEHWRIRQSLAPLALTKFWCIAATSWSLSCCQITSHIGCRGQSERTSCVQTSLHVSLSSSRR